MIPKGTIIIQNNCEHYNALKIVTKKHPGAAFLDPKVFEDPATFYPERFIENSELSGLMDYAFGSGRVRYA